MGELLFFAAIPEQLGLGSSRFRPKKVFDPLYARDLGFQDMHEVRKYVLDQFYKNRGASHQTRGAGVARLICHAERATQDIEFPSGHYKFDRRSPTWCDTWDFKVGDPFTLIGFNDYVGGPPGPHMPDSIPPWLPAHITTGLFFEALDGESHSSVGLYTQNATKFQLFER